MDTSPHRLSVVIPTRNRGNQVIATLDSVFENTMPNFEVILVDQSTNQETADAVKPYLEKENFRYIKTDTQGASRARNVGLLTADGELVAFTDDDCTVPQNWLEMIDTVFRTQPDVAVMFCNVIPAPHDQSAGTIPHHTYRISRSIRTLMGYLGTLGMAAGLAVRSSMIKQLGGFDEYLGPGSLFKSGEDYDLAMRALTRSLVIFETADFGVIHYGYRTNEEFRELTKRDWIGIGAAQAKILKCCPTKT